MGIYNIYVGLSALLVSTFRAMREPLLSGTSKQAGFTFLLCMQSVEKHSCKPYRLSLITISAKVASRTKQYY